MMKRSTTIMILTLTFNTYCASAQDQSLPGKAFSVAMVASEYGYDAGLGVEVGSPGMLNNRVCFRAKGNITWFEQYKATYDHWATYKSLTISIVYNTLVIERSRFYFELGTYYTFPGENFSQKKSIQGITGSTGVELFVVAKPNFHMCYYFSGGYAHSRAYADKLENKPRYGNGFVFNNGFRFYF